MVFISEESCKWVFFIVKNNKKRNKNTDMNVDYKIKATCVYVLHIYIKLDL